MIFLQVALLDVIGINQLNFIMMLTLYFPHRGSKAILFHFTCLAFSPCWYLFFFIFYFFLIFVSLAKIWMDSNIRHIQNILQSSFIWVGQCSRTAFTQIQCLAVLYHRIIDLIHFQCPYSSLSSLLLLSVLSAS